MRNFKVMSTKITVSSPIRKNEQRKCNIISTSSSSSNKEYGKIISYKNREEYGNYRRI